MCFWLHSRVAPIAVNLEALRRKILIVTTPATNVKSGNTFDHDAQAPKKSDVAFSETEVALMWRLMYRRRHQFH